MVDEKTCVWMVVWRNSEGFMDWSCHLLPEAAQKEYDSKKGSGNFEIVILAAVKEWFIG